MNQPTEIMVGSAWVTEIYGPGNPFAEETFYLPAKELNRIETKLRCAAAVRAHRERKSA